MDAKGKHSSGTLQQFETVPAEPKVVCYQGISHGTVIAQRFLALAVDFSSYTVYCLVTFFNDNKLFLTYYHSVESLTGCASGCSLLTHWGDNDTLDHITGDIFVIWFVAPTGAPFTLLPFVQVYSVHPFHQKKSLQLLHYQHTSVITQLMTMMNYDGCDFNDHHHQGGRRGLIIRRMRKFFFQPSRKSGDNHLRFQFQFPDHHHHEQDHHDVVQGGLPVQPGHV